MMKTIKNRAGVDRRIYDGVRLLSDLDPDRASNKNGQGWNGTDGRWGHAIAEKPFEQWTLKMGQMAYKMLRKYAGQLQAVGIAYADIEDPNTRPARDSFVKQEENTTHAHITLEDDTLIYRSPRDHPATALVRALPHRRWTSADGTPPFCWRIARDARNLSGLRDLYRLGTVDFSSDAVAVLKTLSAPQTPSAPQETADSMTPATDAHAAPLSQQEGAPGYVRVAYTVTDDNQIVYRLKLLPAGRFLPAALHTYPTAHTAQAAADQMNKMLSLRHIELS